MFELLVIHIAGHQTLTKSCIYYKERVNILLINSDTCL